MDALKAVSLAADGFGSRIGGQQSIGRSHGRPRHRVRAARAWTATAALFVLCRAGGRDVGADVVRASMALAFIKAARLGVYAYGCAYRLVTCAYHLSHPDIFVMESA